MRLKRRLCMTCGIITILITVMACSNNNQTENPTLDHNKKHFSIPAYPPGMSSVESKNEFMALEFWRNYNFLDEELIRNSKTEKLFIEYINYISRIPDEIAVTSLRRFAKNIKEINNQKSSKRFYDLSVKYFQNPTSEFHNNKIGRASCRERV